MTDEPASLVEPWIIANKVTHPVVILPNGKLEKVIGVEYFPTGAVFLGDQLKWAGSAGGTGSMLGKMRKEATKTPLIPKKLGKIVKAINSTDKVKALNMLRAKLDKFEGVEAEWGKRLDSYMVQNGERAFANATASIANGYWMEASLIAEPYIGKGSQFPGNVEAAAALEALKEDKLYTKEMQGGKLFIKAQDLESQNEFTEAFKVYKSITKKSADSKIAGHAQDAALALIDGRKTGYKSSCMACRKGKGAACKKHYEKQKL